jgi:UDP-N-acetylglucosamine 2-epimerase (non-hydrolysing)
MKMSLILGTRPEIVKMSPLIRACADDDFDYSLVDTGQHYDHEMNQIFFDMLRLPAPHYRLGVGSGSHGRQTGKLLAEIERVLLEVKPDVVLVEGDTNTVLAGGLAATKLHIKVGHVEAGLRSYDRTMPEETNRVLTDHLADLLFAPTSQAADNLAREGISANKVFVTGNTIVDAVGQNLEIAKRESRVLSDLELRENEYFVITMHRPENVDCRERLASLLDSLQAVHERFGRTLVLPLHPRTGKMLQQFRMTVPPGVRVIEPLGFLDFLQLEAHARLILTDSGGVQEEGCILKVPCVTLRDNTERPETVRVGGNVVTGVRAADVLAGVDMMLSSPRGWTNPFGDGKSGRRILDIVLARARGEARAYERR